MNSFDKEQFYRTVKQIAKAIDGEYFVSKRGSWVTVVIEFQVEVDTPEGPTQAKGKLYGRGNGYFNAERELESVYGRWRDSPTGKKVLNLV